MIKKTFIFLTAVTGLLTAAHAVDVTKWTSAQEGCVTAWDLIVPAWTREAQQAGAKWASEAYDQRTLGIWSSQTYGFESTAAALGITRENLIKALREEGSAYRGEVLYFQQQILLAGCLTNIFIKQWPITREVMNVSYSAWDCGRVILAHDDPTSPLGFYDSCIQMSPEYQGIFASRGVVMLRLAYNVPKDYSLYFVQQTYLEICWMHLELRHLCLAQNESANSSKN